jgi:hypothetical protein
LNFEKLAEWGTSSVEERGQRILCGTRYGDIGSAMRALRGTCNRPGIIGSGEDDIDSELLTSLPCLLCSLAYFAPLLTLLPCLLCSLAYFAPLLTLLPSLPCTAAIAGVHNAQSDLHMGLRTTDHSVDLLLPVPLRRLVECRRR